MKARRFEYNKGTSHKYWIVRQSGNEVTVQFGRLGGAGQAKSKDWASSSAARNAAEKLIADKLGKGYVEVANTKIDETSAAKELKRLGAIFRRNGKGRIVDVTISGKEIRDADMSLFAGLADLIELEITVCDHITAKGFKSLENLHRLEDLNLSFTSLTNEGLKSIEKLKNLKRLNLSDTGITDAGVKYFARLPELRSLSLSSTKVSRNGLKQLLSHPALEDLEYGEQYATEERLNCEFFGEIRKRRFQRYIRDGVGKRSAALEVLYSIARSSSAAKSKKKRYPVLNFSQTGLVDQDLKLLSWFPELEHLELGETYVTNRGLAYLSKLKNLKGLVIAETYVTNLKALRPLSRLEYLNADMLDGSKCRLDDAGASCLADFKSLKVLKLFGNPISDATILRLKRLTRLEQLDISFTKASPEAVEELRRALPRCKIEFRQ